MESGQQASSGDFGDAASNSIILGPLGHHSAPQVFPVQCAQVGGPSDGRRARPRHNLLRRSSHRRRPDGLGGAVDIAYLRVASGDMDVGAHSGERLLGSDRGDTSRAF